MPNSPLAPDPNPRHVHLIRHGQSQANVDGIFDRGPLLSPLTALGQQQAEQVAAWAKGRPIGAIYSSPLLRAQQTAAAIAKVLGLQVQTDDLLRETDMGQWHGRHIADIAQHEQAAYAAWHRDPGLYTPPQGESIFAMADRMRLAVEKALEATDSKEIVLISHGDPIHAAFLAVVGAPAYSNGRIELPNVGRVSIAISQPVWRLTYFGPMI